MIYNANDKAVDIKLPAGTWDICVNGTTAGTASVGTASGSVSVDGISAMVLVQGDSTVVRPETAAENQDETSISVEENEPEDTAAKGTGKAPFVAGGIAVAVIAAAAAFIAKKRKK